MFRPKDLAVIFEQNVSPDLQTALLRGLGAAGGSLAKNKAGQTVALVDGVNETSVTGLMKRALPIGVRTTYHRESALNLGFCVETQKPEGGTSITSAASVLHVSMP